MIPITKILVPVVFSTQCRGAVRYAGDLAGRFHAKLVALHVFQSRHVASDRPEVVPGSAAADLIAQTPADAEAQLKKFLNEELQTPVTAERVVLQGDPARSIVRYAHAGEFDLVVMPTHGYGPFRRFLLGSVTAKVLHDADCPVWTGPHMEAAPARDSISVRKVMCAVDLGQQSRAVINWGAELAQAYSADLAIVHAIPSATASLGAFYFDAEWTARLRKAALEQIASLQKDLGIVGDVDVRVGAAPVAIRNAAQQISADVLVIGRAYAPGAFGRLRANAYAMIRESPCPVVSI